MEMMIEENKLWLQIILKRNLRDKTNIKFILPVSKRSFYHNFNRKSMNQKKCLLLANHGSKYVFILIIFHVCHGKIKENT